MKTIKFISAILLAIVITFSFNACSDDDDNDNNNGNNPTGSPIKGFDILFPQSNTLTHTIDLNYENDKISGGKLYLKYFPALESNIYITYTEDKITVSSKGEDCNNDMYGDWRWQVDDVGCDHLFTFVLENGRAKSCAVKSNEDKPYYVYFEYNSEGYLSEISTQKEWYDKTAKINFTYSNGALTKYTYTTGYDDETYNSTYSVTNSKIENKSNLPVVLYMIAAELAGGDERDFNCLYFSYLGIFGNTPKYYPSLIAGGSSKESETVTFDYQFDKNSNISSASFNYKSKSTHYDDEEDNYMLNFKFSY